MVVFGSFYFRRVFCSCFFLQGVLKIFLKSKTALPKMFFLLFDWKRQCRRKGPELLQRGLGTGPLSPYSKQKTFFFKNRVLNINQSLFLVTHLTSFPFVTNNQLVQHGQLAKLLQPEASCSLGRLARSW